MRAWHFVRDDGRLRDGQSVVVGRTYRIDEKPIICERGYHASIRALDALQYAPGSLICRVELGGEIIEGDDKCVASERTVVWMSDATRALHDFALLCAEQALQRERKAGREPDQRSWDALEVKLRWLSGQATTEELLAAREAARAAAREAARAAAREAAWAVAGAAAGAAAWEAAGEAAWEAARAAAWEAAWEAAGEAAGAAARYEQNAELERRLNALHAEVSDVD